METGFLPNGGFDLIDRLLRATLVSSAALSLFLLTACIHRGSFAEGEAATRYAALEEEAKSLIDRRAIVDREFERVARDLDAWAKRHKVFCTARNPEKPSEGWLQFCTYSCSLPRINTGPLKGV
jgi:hypothetical protein